MEDARVTLDYFSFSNYYFYDSLDSYNAREEYISLLKDKLLHEYKIYQNGFYVYSDIDMENLPNQGWKIHISATLKNDEEVLIKTVDILNKFRTPFKIIADRRLLQWSTLKSFSRGSSGKFITIYPKDFQRFKELLSVLYQVLKDYCGPYILTDKRYRDCKVLYYRYGGFTFKYKISDDGHKIALIKDGNGNVVEDKRLPVYSVPQGIEDFSTNTNSPVEHSVLDQKYNIFHALTFSNCGGVYIAHRKTDNQKVILKEARPYTHQTEGRSIIQTRRDEFKLLKKFSRWKICPKAYEEFFEWEHHFIAEEFIKGDSLFKYCSDQNPLYRAGTTRRHFLEYISTVLTFFIKISKNIAIIHRHGYIFGDLSPNNIFITDNKQVKFIDFEACVNKVEYANYMHTQGYSEPVSSGNFFQSDYYSLGCLLFFSIVDRNILFNLNSNTITTFLNELEREYCIPNRLINLIHSLTQSEVALRPSLSKVVKTLQHCISDVNTTLLKDEGKQKELYPHNLRDLLSSIYSSIFRVRNVTKNNMFPVFPIIDNKLNIANGLGGILYGASKLSRNIKFKIDLEELINECKNVNSEDYPVGMYTGLSGLAWALAEAGEVSEAIQMFNNLKIETCDSNGLFAGIAGYGLTAIKMYLVTNDFHYLGLAVRIGEQLIEKAKTKGSEKIYWLNNESFSDIGYKNGNSGISLFFLYLFLSANEQNFLDIGIKAINYDLSFSEIDQFGNYMFRNNDKGEGPLYPYFFEGTAGILSVMLRYHYVCPSAFSETLIYALANSIVIKYSISPNLFMGIGGLCNTLLDCYQLLHDKRFKEQVLYLLRGIELFKVDYQDKILFPADSLEKLSCDLGYGSMGLALLINRYLNDDSNFCFFLDDRLLKKGVV